MIEYEPVHRVAIFDVPEIAYRTWVLFSNIPYDECESAKEYEIIIVSTRCKYLGGKEAIRLWLEEYGIDKYIDDICAEKPPAIVYIDDRAICFDGKSDTLLEQIRLFKPWYKKGK